MVLRCFPIATSREAFKSRFGIADLFYPDNRIKALGTREGIPVITLAPELQDFAEHNNVFSTGLGAISVTATGMRPAIGWPVN